MYKTILMPELSQIMQKENINLVDVRELDEYEDGHIKGSLHMPLSRFQHTYKNLDKTKHYYILCYSGSRSMMVCDFLGKQGYDVTNVMGGISTYRGPLQQ